MCDIIKTLARPSSHRRVTLLIYPAKLFSCDAVAFQEALGWPPCGAFNRGTTWRRPRLISHINRRELRPPRRHGCAGDPQYEARTEVPRAHATHQALRRRQPPLHYRFGACGLGVGVGAHVHVCEDIVFGRG